MRPGSLEFKMAYDFIHLTAKQLEEINRTQTVFFFSVGALEDHGPHLPVGLDLLEATALCRMAGEKVEREMPGWSAVIMPPMPIGLETYTTKLALTSRPHVLRDYLVDSCRGLIRAGFQHFVCFSGTLSPRQLTAIEDAGKIITRTRFFSRKKIALVSASSALVSAKVVFKSPLRAMQNEHGGARDTSVALALDPAMVSTDFATLPEKKIESLRAFFKVTRSSYWGAPAQAKAERGKQILLTEIDEIYPKLKAVLTGTNPNLIFRSWYSIIPPNKSFFRAWVLFFIVFVIALVWIYMNSQSG